MRLIAALDGAGIPYMVTGSLASSHHGVGRATRDIEVVVEPDQKSLDAFMSGLPASGYHADAQTAQQAPRRRSQFNVVDLSSGWKID